MALATKPKPHPLARSGGPRPALAARWKRVLAILGPGLVTGAADDDPSGVTTYSMAGAQFGNGLLWTALLSWPLMAAVQMMCARVGLATGEGLAAALKRQFPRPVLMLAAVSLLIANTINIGADLSGMADAATELTGGPRAAYSILFASAIALATVRIRYARLASILKWLVATLFSYVATAIVVQPHWTQVLHDLALPHLPRTKEAWGMLVALLGTTISPYLFFWQSSQEVELKKAGRPSGKDCTPAQLRERGWDVVAGSLVSNLVMFFIILTCSITLHAHGRTQISTAGQAAQALRPLAGPLATVLYTLGLIGTGLLAIPTLAGASAYALAETFDLSQGLDEPFGKARPFYLILVTGILAGLGVALSPINPIKALYATAVINGVLAPVLLVGLIAVARNKASMNERPSPGWEQGLVGLTALLMAGAAVAMFIL